MDAPQHRSAINGLPLITASFLKLLYLHGCKTLIRSAIKDRNAYITRTFGAAHRIRRDTHETHTRKAGTLFLRSDAITTSVRTI